MINSIIDGICLSIDNEFGDDYTIYTDKVEQGMNVPCFFVQCINPTNALFLGNRKKRTNQMCISYFPSGDETNIECHSVSERLFECLHIIETGSDKLLGSDMYSEIEDGVLHFFVNYDLFTYKAENKTKMKALDVTSDVRG